MKSFLDLHLLKNIQLLNKKRRHRTVIMCDTAVTGDYYENAKQIQENTDPILRENCFRSGCQKHAGRLRAQPPAAIGSAHPES